MEPGPPRPTPYRVLADGLRSAYALLVIPLSKSGLAPRSSFMFSMEAWIHEEEEEEEEEVSSSVLLPPILAIAVWVRARARAY